VATQSGGGLRLDSSLGRGTTVSVYLPRARRVSATPRELENRSAPVGFRASILVVDDDADVREVAVAGLENLGYRMLAAENGPAALNVLAGAERVDLLLVDMAMPGMSGVELIRRARECRPGLRAMLVTGYADVAAFSPAEEDLVLQKPYRLERLAAGVAEALRRKMPKTRLERGSNESLSTGIEVGLTASFRQLIAVAHQLVIGTLIDRRSNGHRSPSPKLWAPSGKSQLDCRSSGVSR